MLVCSVCPENKTSCFLLTVKNSLHQWKHSDLTELHCRLENTAASWTAAILQQPNGEEKIRKVVFQSEFLLGALETSASTSLSETSTTTGGKFSRG